jgi:hypothetical protein
MAKEKPPIITLIELLLSLQPGYEPGDRKTGAVVRQQLREEGVPAIYTVVEFFDNGGGHPGVFSSEETLLEPNVFFEALRLGVIIGVSKGRAISETSYVLSDAGRRMLTDHYDEERLRREKEEIASHIPEFNND